MAGERGSRCAARGRARSQRSAWVSFWFKAITNSEAFALHNVDFADINPGVDLTAYYQAVVTRDKHGVTHAAGLRWPRVRGKNKGRPYQFSCEPTPVVRDVVNFCPIGLPNAYYRLPFADGEAGWTQSQGNNGQPAHAGALAFAYDMVAACGTGVIAARGGVALAVIEANAFQHEPGCGADPAGCCPAKPVSCSAECCTANWCFSNNVLIRHQDGTRALYVHMPKDGVKPNEGDLVPRGGVIASVGTIGNSSGPHLHWEVDTSAPGRTTTLALFEARDPADADQVLTCYAPQQNDALSSNNVKQP